MLPSYQGQRVRLLGAKWKQTTIFTPGADTCWVIYTVRVEMSWCLGSISSCTVPVCFSTALFQEGVQDGAVWTVCLQPHYGPPCQHPGGLGRRGCQGPGEDGRFPCLENNQVQDGDTGLNRGAERGIAGHSDWAGSDLALGSRAGWGRGQVSGLPGNPADPRVDKLKGQPGATRPTPEHTLRNSDGTKQSHERSRSSRAGRTPSVPGENARVGGWREGPHSQPHHPPPPHIPQPGFSSL